MLILEPLQHHVTICLLMSPTQRTLAELKSLGFQAGVVERFVRQAGPFGKRFDLFGCIDLIAMHKDAGIFGIQATSAANHAARRTKSLAEPRLQEWLIAGGRFEIWSWGKKGKAGSRKTYQLRREELTFADCIAESGRLEAFSENSEKIAAQVKRHASFPA